MIVYLTCYPRSGNTLCRQLIRHYFGRVSTSVYEESDQPIYVNGDGNIQFDADKRFRILRDEMERPYRVPIDGCHLTPDFRQELAESAEVFFIKTHEYPFEEYFKGEFAIRIVRHPGAALWSYYHYLVEIEQQSTTLEEVIIGSSAGIQWSKYTEAWLKAERDLAVRCFKVKYEELIQSEESFIRKVQEWTDLPLKNPFGTFPKFEYLHQKSPNLYGRGKADEWKNKLAHEQLLQIYRHHADAMSAEGYAFDFAPPPYSGDYETRIHLARLGMIDVANLPKVSNAGRIIEQDNLRFQVMFNGIKVPADSYYGPRYTELIRQCQGHHEPQEEFVFDYIVNKAPEGATMMELGSFWAFYSAWFLTHVQNSRAILVEPSPANIAVSLGTLALNNCHASIELGALGERPPDFEEIYLGNTETPNFVTPLLTVDELMKAHFVEHLFLLHSDIQGAEVKMLEGATNAIETRRIDYILISTHSNDIHHMCLDKLMSFNYHIIAEHDVFESYTYDGLIVACSDQIQDVDALKIHKRSSAEWTWEDAVKAWGHFNHLNLAVEANFAQEIAREMSLDKQKKYIDSIDYQNEGISADATIYDDPKMPPYNRHIHSGKPSQFKNSLINSQQQRIEQGAGDSLNEIDHRSSKTETEVAGGIVELETEPLDLAADSNKRFAEIGQFNSRTMLGRLHRAIQDNVKLGAVDWLTIVDYIDSPEGRSEYGFVFDTLPTQPNGPVLFIGTGVIPLAYLIAESGWKTVAANREVTAVQLLNQVGVTIFEAEVEHHVNDPRSITLAPAQFEVVIAPGVLNSLHSADIPVALAEMFRACRPSGRILITFRITPEIQAVFKLLLDSEKDPQALTTLLSAGINQLIGLVINAPDNKEQFQHIIQDLRKIALDLPYPPSGVNYQNINTAEYGSLWVNNDSLMTNALTYGDFDTKVFEHDVHVFFQNFLRSGDVVFDVGANIGAHTVQISQLVGELGAVHAFEPSNSTFDCLVRNTLSAGNNVYLNPIALSVENGILQLNKPSSGQAGLNSFGSPIGSGASLVFEHELSWTMVLDDYMRSRNLEDVTAIKIDVEGWEERVLRGAITTLLVHRPVIVLELTTQAAHNANSSIVTVAKLLQALGYDLYRYVVANQTLEVLESDRENWRYTNAVAVPRNRLEAVQERLAGKDSPFTDTAAENVELKALFEENRSLRQRIMSGIFDREITLLDQLLQHREADREARLAAIQQLQSRIIELEAELTKRQKEYEAMATVVNSLQEKAETQDIHLGQANEQLHDYEIQLAELNDRQNALQMDYDARMDVVNSLSEMLEAHENRIAAIKQRKIVKLMRRLGRPLV